MHPALPIAVVFGFCPLLAAAAFSAEPPPIAPRSATVAPSVSSAANSTGKSPAEAAGAKVSIETLIAQLGDNNYRVRQAAGRQLAERGEEALPALRKALDSRDAEVQRRADVLTHEIERGVLLSPKRVSIKLKNRPIQEAVQELARLTGYKLRYQGGQPRTVTIEMENATYWQVLEKICDLGELSPAFDDQQGLVYLYQQNTICPYTYLNGPFRFVAQNFNYNRYVNLANLPRNGFGGNMPGDNSNLSFGFMIQSEPKTPILSVGTPRLSKAVDENGVSLIQNFDENQQFFNAQYNDFNGMFRNYQHSTAVQLVKPSKDSAQAKLVKGTVKLTLLSSTRADLTIDNLKPGKNKYKASGDTAEVQIDEIAQQNNMWMLTMHVKRHIRDGDPPDYNWINGVHQKLELYDAKGNRYQSQGVNNFMNNTPASVQATFQFAAANNAKLGPPVKLVLVEWLSIAQEVDFEFKNLPLP